jgi:hypothetical protein
MALLCRVLARLQEKGFSINQYKYEWAVQETDPLGHWITPTGLNLWKKKVDAILALTPPKKMKYLHSSVGMINFYCHMYPQCSHVLAPLMLQTCKNTLVWTNECHTAFEKAKTMLAHDAFIRYLNHNQAFHVYADASDYQLGAGIVQNNVPIAYFSRKLNPAQRNYTTMEEELLSIVDPLKKFRSMLFGCHSLHVYTDHKNLTYSKSSSQRVTS